MQKNFSYELFEKALLHKNLSAYDFCKLAKIHSGTVSNWKNVKEVKKLSHRAAIERVLGVEYENVCVPENGKTGEVNHHSDIVKITSWPVVSAVSAGPWIDNIDRLSDGEILGREPIQTDFDDENGYGLIVTGDSMSPNYLPGDLLAVSPNREIHNGGYGVVFINNYHGPYGCEIVFKRVFFTNGKHVILRSLNQDYPPMDKAFGAILWRAWLPLDFGMDRNVAQQRRLSLHAMRRKIQAIVRVTGQRFGCGDRYRAAYYWLLRHHEPVVSLFLSSQ